MSGREFIGNFPSRPVVLVTGAASGIGRGFALRLARPGAHLWLVDCDADRLQLVRAEAESRGANVTSVVLDVGSRAAIEALFGRFVAEGFAALDLLVNAAGTLSVGGLLDTSLDDFERIHRVNLLGTAAMMKLFAPAMVERGRGQIINISSASAFVGFSSILAYSTSKFGVLGLSQAASAEFAPHGVVVTCVCPALVRTELWRSSALAGSAEQKVRSVLERRGVSVDLVVERALRGADAGRVIVRVGWLASAVDWLGRLLPERAPGWIHRRSG